MSLTFLGVPDPKNFTDPIELDKPDEPSEKGMLRRVMLLFYVSVKPEYI